MRRTPESILQDAYRQAQQESAEAFLSRLPQDDARHLRTIVECAEAQKGVLGVTLTSVVYKIHQPSQDIRRHQARLPKGYSGRTFDTKYVTPFLQAEFPHLAMAESAWLTRSLEQPHPYDLNYPGRIQNKELKASFLGLLDQLQSKRTLARPLLLALFALLLERTNRETFSPMAVSASTELTVARIVEAVSQHMHHNYRSRGAARIPVLAIYAVYQLLMKDVRRYEGKMLAPLESHTSPDARARTLGDIEVLNGDGSRFEAIEIKHRKPVTVGMVDIALRKIRETALDRYYILTTSEPNFVDFHAVSARILEIGKLHSCQIIVNGVLPTLKYYLRLVSQPGEFVEVFEACLRDEFNRGSGIKQEHLETWARIRTELLY